MARAALFVHVVLAACAAVPQRSAAAPAADPTVARFERLAKRYERSQREQLPISELRGELLSIADTLTAAGRDSLAIYALEAAAELFDRQGLWSESQRVIERELEIARRGGHRRLEAWALTHLSIVQFSTGKFAEGARTTAQVLPIYEELDDSWMQGVSWGNLAAAYLMLGRLTEAIVANEQALAAARRAGNSFGVASAHGVAAELFLLSRRPLEALAYADSALAAAEPNRWKMAIGTSLEIRAGALLALGRAPEALDSVRGAIRAREEIGDESNLLASRLAEAALHLRMGAAETSLAIVEDLLPSLRSLGEGTKIQTALALQGHALLSLGRTLEAETVLDSAIVRFEGLRSSHEDTATRVGLYLRGGEAYASLARAQLAAGDTLSAWKTTERGRSGVLRDALGLPAGQDAVTWDALRATLDQADAALLLFNDPTLNPLVVFVATGSSLHAFELGRPDEIGAAAAAVLDLLAAETPAGPRLDAPLSRLAHALLDAPLATLPVSVRRLYIAPPAILAGFPFELLPHDGTELLDRFATSYVASASTLEALLRRPASSSGTLAWADPVSTAPSGAPERIPDLVRTLRETPLPFARREADRVAPGTVVRAGADATEESVRTPEAAAASVLHFATHALVTPLSPGTSGLILAGSEGLLTAAEAESLRLRADLVTLSACQTAGGFAHLGEGVDGLPRAFLLAGARSVVASLWSVEDRATERFMSSFYAELRRGRPRDEALAAARRNLAADGYGPRERAAFVLHGVGHVPVDGLVGASGSWHRPGSGTILSLALIGVLLVLAVALGVSARTRRG